MYPPKHDQDNGLERVIADYMATGRVVTIHPRKYTISLNGFRPIPYAEAYKKMVECLTSK